MLNLEEGVVVDVAGAREVVVFEAGVVGLVVGFKVVLIVMRVVPILS